jgi:hypothetical protein
VPFGGYNSVDASETFTVFDVDAANVAALRNTASQTGRTDIYNDLGGGLAYGDRDFTAADAPFTQTFTDADVLLDEAAFLANVNAARGGFFAVGGAITTIVGSGTQTVLGFTGTQTPVSLVLNVPSRQPWPPSAWRAWSRCVAAATEAARGPRTNRQKAGAAPQRA